MTILILLSLYYSTKPENTPDKHLDVVKRLNLAGIATEDLGTRSQLLQIVAEK